MLPDLLTLCPLNFGVSIAWKQILTPLVSPSLGGQSLFQGFLLLNGSFFLHSVQRKAKNYKIRVTCHVLKAAVALSEGVGDVKPKFCYRSLVCLNSS